MTIGLFDTDNYQKGYSYPNLPLMKISEFNKRKGIDVEFVDLTERKYYDIIYQSKVFTFTKDVDLTKYGNKIIRGGTGYAIQLINSVETYNPLLDSPLTDEIEHIYPDYALYNISDIAYGFITRGCARKCDFCHVYNKEGATHKVSELEEFWNGQRNIVLMDPNILMYKGVETEIERLIKTSAYIDFNQGIDARLLTPEICKLLAKCKIKQVHFAMDHVQNCEEIADKIYMFKKIAGYNRGRISVYILVNFDTTLEEDLKRIELCRNIGVTPYVMRYNKGKLKRGSIYNALARWVNNKKIFWNCENFWGYLADYKNGMWR